ncbi:MAG: thioredoxin, partial [Chloroflexi bacterium]|nr:thioredoxin [Chloroflexota bacterium]
VHMIPRGLPGEGNILVYDNGGWAGYGAPNEGSPTGHRAALRDYTRVIEFDPITLAIVWQYPATIAGPSGMQARYSVYSPLMSSAQRLVNGNTLISEGNSARIFEVTREGKVVWEFVNPFQESETVFQSIYRAYRVPYDWVPQVEPPKEVPVPRIDNSLLRVPGSVQQPKKARRKVAAVAEDDTQLCAVPDEAV